jgi:hypothetical protein
MTEAEAVRKQRSHADTGAVERAEGGGVLRSVFRFRLGNDLEAVGIDPRRSAGELELLQVVREQDKLSEGDPLGAKSAAGCRHHAGAAGARTGGLDGGDGESQRGLGSSLRAQQRGAEDADGEGADDRGRGGRYEKRFSSGAQRGQRALRQDAMDALLQIGAGHAGCARQRRFQTETADARDPLGIVHGIAAAIQHFLVARTFALVDKTRADPPHERVEPEERLDDHVDRGGQVVAPANVAELVSQDRVELGGGETLEDRGRQKKDGAEESDHPGLQADRSGHDGHRRVDRQALRGASRRTDHAPSDPAASDDDRDADCPDDRDAGPRRRRGRARR